MVAFWVACVRSMIRKEMGPRHESTRLQDTLLDSVPNKISDYIVGMKNVESHERKKMRIACGVAFDRVGKLSF